MGLQIPVSLPAGSISPFAGATAPDGWLFMYGQAVSRATYAALFLAIGTTFGAGDGSTTFNLPDARGRVLFGKDDMGGTPANRATTGGGGLNGAALGAVGGSEAVTLSAAQMPSHNHEVHMGYGAHNAQLTIGPFCRASLGDAPNTDATMKGGGGAHQNIPPAIVVNYIIKT